jgi:hypothetical protein
MAPLPLKRPGLMLSLTYVKLNISKVKKRDKQNILKSSDKDKK